MHTNKHTEELEEDNQLELGVGHRLAFREFGAIMGIKCYEDLRDQDYWKFWIQKIMKVWRQAGQVPTPTGEMVTLPNLQKLAPITLVMFCAALEPGGELSLDIICCRWADTYASLPEGILLRVLA